MDKVNSNNNKQAVSKQTVKKKKKKNRGLIILLIMTLIALALVVALIFIMQKDGNKPEKQDTDFYLVTKSVEVEAGKNLAGRPITDFVAGKEKYTGSASINTDNVNFDKIGKYQAEITSGDKKLYLDVIVNDTVAPSFELLKNSIRILTGSKLDTKEFVNKVDDVSTFKIGFVEDVNATDPVLVMKDELSFASMGSYTVGVIVVDEARNYLMKNIRVVVNDNDYTTFLNYGSEVEIDENTDMNSFSNQAIPYGLAEGVDGKNRPDGCGYYKTKYGKYAADFIQPYSDYVYLTYNETKETGNTSKILDTLKAKNAKAVFFVTLSYAQANNDLIKRMIDEGHVVGNLTATYNKAGLPTMSTEEITEEIDAVTRYIKETFNYDMYLLRVPEIMFSERVLAIAQKLGYRTVFWSFVYNDRTTAGVDEKTALANVIKRLHGGGIYLFHAESDANTNFLAKLIDAIRSKNMETGYYARMD